VFTCIDDSAGTSLMLKETLNNTFFLAAKIFCAVFEFKNSLLRSAGLYSVCDMQR
jgi:hypothetical protein